MSEDEIKTEKPDKILKIVKEILEFNEQNQSGKGLKILNQTKCLVDYQFLWHNWKQEIIRKKLKMKLDNYCILCTIQKNLQSNSIKVWSTLFKNGNNLYEQWK